MTQNTCEGMSSELVPIDHCLVVGSLAFQRPIGLVFQYHVQGMFQSCYCYDIYHVLLKTDAVHMWCWRQQQSCWWCCRLMCNLISPLLGPSVHQMHLPFYFFSLLSIASWAGLTGYAGLLCWFTWRPWFVIPLSCCTTVKLRHCSLVHLIEMHGSLHVIEIVSF